MNSPGATEQTFVVTSAADEKKGERLVVLHKLKEELLSVCLEKLTACDLPNLWKPKADAFLRVESFPLLGHRQARPAPGEGDRRGDGISHE